MSTSIRFSALTVALIGAIGVSTATQAATTNGPIAVTINITNACTITTNPLDFGSTSALATNIDVDTQVAVLCSGAAPVSIAFDAGSGTGSTIAARKMSGPGGAVDYNLYREAGRTTILGQTSGPGGNTIDFTSTAGTTVFSTIFGRVPSQTLKPVGSYASTVTATLTF